MVDKAALRVQLEATYKWLIRSFEQTGWQGSAHSYSYWLNGNAGWAEAYPETTGYILETLQQYQEQMGGKPICELIIQQANWLTTIAQTNGSYLSGRYQPYLSKQPSIFNSGQILFGLMTGYKMNKDQKYLTQIQKTVSWLLDAREKDGSWTQWGWRNSSSPAYYSRVIWPILLSSQLLGQFQDIKQVLAPTIIFYRQLLLPNGTFEHWGFEKDKSAFTHTIAYTLRGWLEIYRLTKDPNIYHLLQHSLQSLMKRIRKEGRLAGAYDNDWQGDFSFICVTGHLQLSIVFYLWYEMVEDESFMALSISLFQQVFPYINNKKHRGGIPGSIPFYGKYNPLRYPNWAAKFFMDYGLMVLKE